MTDSSITREEYEDLKATRIEKLVMGVHYTTIATDMHNNLVTDILGVLLDYLNPPEEVVKEIDKLVEHYEEQSKTFIKKSAQAGADLDKYAEEDAEASAENFSQGQIDALVEPALDAVLRKS